MHLIITSLPPFPISFESHANRLFFSFIRILIFIPPIQDIYHSCLALAILAIWKEPGLKTFDPALCVSIEHREKVIAQRAAALTPSQTYWKRGYGFSVREDDPDFAKKMAESEDPPKGAVIEPL